MTTANQSLMKQINKAIVLNTIRKNDTISRIEISNTVGLNKSTISGLVDELITDGLILETGIGVSRVGRKPVMLMINPNAYSIIGIDMGVNYILSVLTNFAGEIIWEKRIAISVGALKEKRIEWLVGLLEETINNAPQTVKGILGIGIGLPGIVNYEKGLVLVAPNLGWKNVNFREVIENKFHTPVFIDNEANTGALGEKWFGLGKKASDFLYISVGIGIGVGVIINDDLYRGAYGLAGEMGHMTIEINGENCSCGNSGCWEEYASEKALYNYLGKHYMRDKMTVLDIIEAAKIGDQQAINAFRHVGKHLGIGVANLINAFNPNVVIIGNTLGLAGAFIMDELRSEVWKNCFSAKYFAVQIVASELNAHACAIGAISLVISKAYATPVVRKW